MFTGNCEKVAVTTIFSTGLMTAEENLNQAGAGRAAGKDGAVSLMRGAVREAITGVMAIGVAASREAAAETGVTTDGKPEKNQA